jgi:hypothetical protein
LTGGVGPAGPQGPNGLNPISWLDAGYSVPPIGELIVVGVDNSWWMQLGAYCSAGNAAQLPVAYFKIQAVSGPSVTLERVA